MSRYYSKSELIQQLKQAAQTLGRTPAPQDMSEPPAAAYLTYFKKWPKALKAAGLDGVKAPAQAAPSAKPQKIQPQAEASDTPAVTPALQQTAPGDNAPTTRRYSKTIISKMLLDEFQRLGKKPTRKEIDANKDLPTVATCLKYFDTTRIGDVWDEVLKSR
jgi:hypothetical protein